MTYNDVPNMFGFSNYAPPPTPAYGAPPPPPPATSYQGGVNSGSGGNAYHGYYAGYYQSAHGGHSDGSAAQGYPHQNYTQGAYPSQSYPQQPYLGSSTNARVHAGNSVHERFRSDGPTQTRAWSGRTNPAGHQRMPRQQEQTLMYHANAVPLPAPGTYEPVPPSSGYCGNNDGAGGSYQSQRYNNVNARRNGAWNRNVSRSTSAPLVQATEAGLPPKPAAPSKSKKRAYGEDDQGSSSKRRNLGLTPEEHAAAREKKRTEAENRPIGKLSNGDLTIVLETADDIKEYIAQRKLKFPKSRIAAAKLSATSKVSEDVPSSKTVNSKAGGLDLPYDSDSTAKSVGADRNTSSSPSPSDLSSTISPNASSSVSSPSPEELTSKAPVADATTVEAQLKMAAAKKARKEINCRDLIETGYCKFRARCRYNHTIHGITAPENRPKNPQPAKKTLFERCQEDDKLNAAFVGVMYLKAFKKRGLLSKGSSVAVSVVT